MPHLHLSGKIAVLLIPYTYGDNSPSYTYMPMAIDNTYLRRRFSHFHVLCTYILYLWQRFSWPASLTERFPYSVSRGKQEKFRRKLLPFASIEKVVGHDWKVANRARSKRHKKLRIMHACTYFMTQNGSYENIIQGPSTISPNLHPTKII